VGVVFDQGFHVGGEAYVLACCKGHKALLNEGCVEGFADVFLVS
jgi:hypothetical protein